MDGYINKFDVYQEKVADHNETSTPSENEGTSNGVGFMKKNHKVYFDNFFHLFP